MSDSESEKYVSTPVVEQKKRSNSRKPAADGSNKKRKQPSTSNSTTSRKKSTIVSDIVGVSKGETYTTNDEDSQLASYFVNRVGVECERRVATTEGAYYVDLKEYKSEDARSCDSVDLWKKGARPHQTANGPRRSTKICSVGGHAIPEPTKVL